MQSLVDRIWYGGGYWHWLLLPLEILFWTISTTRRSLFRLGVLSTINLDVPVVVVGNITAGGTGKTPVTLWLATTLKSRGFNPGIVSRGYGGRGQALEVRSDSSAAVVGDEPLLLARRSGCPVVVNADRVAAAKSLIDAGVDVIIADDGLQHYRLGRDYEFCVIDAERGFGNGHLIPAGPLREGQSRLRSVDQILVNGSGTKSMPAGALHFQLALQDAVRVDGEGTRSLKEFSGVKINAAAAIGNPQRFFRALHDVGLDCVEHAYPDHADISLGDFDSSVPLLITEKDAVKLSAEARQNVWYVPVELQIEETAADHCIEQLVSRLKRPSHV